MMVLFELEGNICTNIWRQYTFRILGIFWKGWHTDKFKQYINTLRVQNKNRYHFIPKTQNWEYTLTLFDNITGVTALYFNKGHKIHVSQAYESGTKKKGLQETKDWDSPLLFYISCLIFGCHMIRRRKWGQKNPEHPSIKVVTQ